MFMEHCAAIVHWPQVLVSLKLLQTWSVSLRGAKNADTLECDQTLSLRCECKYHSKRSYNDVP